MLLIRAQHVVHSIMIAQLPSSAFDCISCLFPSFRIRCQSWSVSCRPALRTLWSVCAPTPVVSQTVLTASMCLPSCSTSGCLRWCAWSVMDTLSACLFQASSPGQCWSMLHNYERCNGHNLSSEVIVLSLYADSFTSHPPLVFPFLL